MKALLRSARVGIARLADRFRHAEPDYSAHPDPHIAHPVHTTRLAQPRTTTEHEDSRQGQQRSSRMPCLRKRTEQASAGEKKG